MLVILLLFSSLLQAQDSGAPFEKWIESKNVKVTCTGEINDVFIFSINLIDLNQAHDFLVMRGIEPETCIAMRGRVKRILRSNKKIFVSGFAGTPSDSGKTLIHQWKLVRGKNSCVSWWEGDCRK